MISFEDAMEKAEEMRRQAHEALRDLPEVSEVLNESHLTGEQHQAIRSRLQPMWEAQDALNRLIDREGPGGPTWEQPPDHASIGRRIEAESSGGPTWERSPRNVPEAAGGVGVEGPGGGNWEGATDKSDDR